jgi:hypothetical protein
LFNWATQKYLENSRRKVPLDQPFTQADFDREFDKTEWRKRYTSTEAQARREQADPRLRQDWLESIRKNEDFVRGVAEKYGIQLTDTEITEFATQARLQGWDQTRLERALAPALERTLQMGEGITGRAGDAENQLLNWARQNGLNLSRQAAAKYIANITMGTQSLDDAKNDIRRTYMAGMFPGWADKINEGFDPSDLFEPYMDSLARLLEIGDRSNISFDDPLMKRATQSIGPDGKPMQMPLYQFEEEIRKDPRWQYTDNAYESYSNVGTQLLRMFGFR